MSVRDRRSYSLEIGSIKIESISTKSVRGPDSLQFEFSVSRDNSTTPNAAEFTIRNLSPEHRMVLGQSEQVVKFSAGYQQDLELIFYGVVNSAVSQRETDGSVTTYVRAGDGQSQLITSKVSKSFARGALVSDVVKALASAIGAQPGNLGIWAPLASLKSGPTLPHALVLSGDAASAMSALCASLGWSWCVQNGQLELTKQGLATSQGPLISPTSGLIGSPQIEPKGVVTFQCLLMLGVVPQSQVMLMSEYVTGPTLLSATRHYGNTHGQDWQIDAKGVLQ